MAQIKDIMGMTYKYDNNGNIYSVKQKEEKISVLPYVKLTRHFKKIENQVRTQESKAYAMGYDVYEFRSDKSPKFELTDKGLIFVPDDKKKKKA